MFDLIPAHTFTMYALTSVKSCLLSYSSPANIYRAKSHLKPRVCFEPILLMQSPRVRMWDFSYIFDKRDTLVLNKFV